ETSRQSRARYFYDAFGRRIAKEVNGERTVFGWDGDTLAYESDGERGTHYIYEPGTFVPLAQYVAGPVDGIATPEWKSTDRYVPEEDPLQKVPERRGVAALFYYHCDQIGTPQLLTDGDGDVVWEASYKAWGEAREVIARASKAAGIVVGNSLRFQGQQVDEETGLHYNRYRYYDPKGGRFVSLDPIKLHGGLNNFQYAPNPVEWTDALGLVRLRETDPRGGSLSDVQTRCWYKREESRIDQQLCNCKNLKERARLAHKLRNQARIRARLLMADRDAATALYTGINSPTGKAEPMLTWKETVAKANGKGYQGGDVYNYIIGSSKRSRPGVDKMTIGDLDCDKVLNDAGI
ncbi:RHS repeat-associated core domain-containing protein, partial [Burkholderia anthina]|uniref:RHS repeat-associated core domain-containing protein n=2 Tax=Burkholderia cepacia complex TaxID=87882 RepID=UPI0021AB47D7